MLPGGGRGRGGRRPWRHVSGARRRPGAGARAGGGGEEQRGRHRVAEHDVGRGAAVLDTVAAASSSAAAATTATTGAGRRRSHNRRGAVAVAAVAVVGAAGDGRRLQVAVGRLEVRLGAPLLQHDAPRRPEDLVVDDDHHGQRDVERPQRGVDLMAETSLFNTFRI